MRLVDSAFMKRVKHVHFVGIGGAGMAGIAQVLLNQGFCVSGSDRVRNALVNRLEAMGAQVYLEHKAEQIEKADVLVVSSAVGSDNCEIQAAHESHIPVVHRAEMLAELMRFHEGIAVAGTHGKTTTTSLITSIFSEAGLDPTFVIGGLVHQFGGHAQLGQSKHFIVEADESDASFLCLYPTIAVVTNVDRDHMHQYDYDEQILKKTFVNFLHRLPFYGLSVICWDDPGARSLIPHLKTKVVTYGFLDGADLKAADWRQVGLKSYFDLHRSDGSCWKNVELNLAGKHNVLNALAAIAIADEEGIEREVILKALAHFAGIGRRFQKYGPFRCEGGDYDVIDDYGHHPREMAVTLEAIRQVWPERRVLMVFQPHRYTRTRDLFEDFVKVLSQTDGLILLDVYPAGEDVIPEANGRALARAIRLRGQVEPVFLETVVQVKEQVERMVQPGDVVLFQGAGDIGTLAPLWQSPFSMAVAG